MPITRLPLQVFRCPTCRADLEVEGQTAGYGCPGCGFVPAADGGVIDLVRAGDRGAEREYCAAT